MNRPDLYHKTNYAQRCEVENVVKMYSKKMQFLPDGGDSLIDLGSGSGDTLMDFVYPLLPKNYQRFVCSDINPTMLEYAREHVVTAHRAEFRILDMAMEQPLPIDLKGQFDHVTSFYAFMYAKTLKNIYDLLKENGGDCLIASLSNHILYPTYIKLSQMEKWSQYMTDVQSFIAPQYYSEDVRRDIINYLIDVGFSDYIVDVVPTTFVYENVKAFKDNIVGCSPFLGRIDNDLHEEYMHDFLTISFSCMGLKMNYSDYQGPLPISYTNLFIYARELPQKCD
ncbi:juvenile hormone acid O-methyltransferase-like [Haematobia irritans]|uniref:juvenile hormone acid O-methyltransferase-like n=1 Tax=Haematobia irritans TaxID=7368 RepID=UPI003F4FF0DA